jgi:ribonuclease PH
MTLNRKDNRPTSTLRPITIQKDFYDYAEGSCLISFGNTQVLCVATWEESPPPHLRGKGVGWITGEYNMLPRASPERISRERNKVGGRTMEIQRLIGRALRTTVNCEGWGEKTIMLDCDVIKADGGTRTASITGAFVALTLAFRRLRERGRIPKNLAFPIKDYVSAVSVGIVQGQPALDLDYSEDSTADTDMNFVMNSKGEVIEIQGTAEKRAMTQGELTSLIDLGRKGCESLCNIQREVLGPLDWGAGRPL